jgi:hypothetical protein
VLFDARQQVGRGGRDSSTVLAPTAIGNSSNPPRPKVKASGGLPMKTSSARARSTCGGQHAHAAITSRWKCMVALGTPVVPEVKASRQVSSAAVSTASNALEWRAIAASSALAAPPKSSRCFNTGCASAASSSSAASSASHSAWLTWPMPMMAASSRARSSGMVATAMPPAFITANQQAAIIGVFGARSSTRLPGTRPRSCTSTRATWLERACKSA